MIVLTGKMTCALKDAAKVRAALDEHISLTRAESGCLSFDVTETDPGEFRVREQFTDQAAFDAHQTRTKSSTWFQVTLGMPREYQITEE